MNKAVIYARFSSSKQREESIEGQIRECTAFAARQELEIDHIYADRAISGRTDSRPEFQRMIADSSKKLFKYVIVYTFDRFARNRYDSAIYKLRLKMNGVRVLSAKENIDNSPSGVLMESIFEGMAEYYSLELAQKVKRGLKENALKGRWASGPIPFGYMRDADRKLIFNPDTIGYLRKMFEMAAKQEKFSAIAEYLNSHGVPTSVGGKWNKNSFRRLMTNPIVIGTYRWDDVVIENYIEPAISKELFKQVQHRFDLSPRKGKVNVMKSAEYLLTPNIVCGECGSPMHGMCGKSKNGSLYYYYECAGKRTKKTVCDMPSVPRDDLEDAIFEEIKSLLGNKSNINTIADELVALIKSEDDTTLKSLEKRLAQAKSERDKGLDTILKGFFTPSLGEKIKELEAQIDTMEEELSKLRYEITPFKITKEHVVFFLSKMAQADKEQILSSLVRDVTVNKKDSNGNYPITVRLNYEETPALSNEIDLTGVRKDSKLVIHRGFEPRTP